MRNLKLYLISTITFFYITSYAQQQFPNNGFEDWAIDAISGFLSPTSWTVWRGFSDSASVVQASGYSGNYCSHLSVIYDSINNSYKSCGLYITLPINQIPDSVAGYFKFVNASGNSSLNYDYTFYQSPGQPINMGLGSIPNNSNWNRFAYRLSTSGTPTSMTVNFGLNSVTSTNQYAEIDDLQFIYSTTELNQIDNIITSFTLFPSISNGNINLNISCTKMSSLSFSIYDYSGKIVSSLKEQTISFGNHLIPLRFDLPNGLYILKLNSAQGSKILKFVIEN